jgi:tricorn protease
MKRVLFAVCALALTATPALAQVDARMFRYPDVSDTHITFVYAGDIWVVGKAGGTATRLSSPPGEELFPRYSPDGSQIAFSGNYDGNTDVYVVPSMGGEPQRITYHPSSDRLVDWSPDGRQLLVASGRESGVQRFNQLYLVSARGGLPEKLPVPYGEFGTLSPDGRQLAYTPKDRGFRNWKRYRGGMAPEIWLMDLRSRDARNISNSDANDAQPMWHGQTLYFLSDRGPAQRNNIWAMEIDSGQMRQVTRFSEFDVTFPGIGPSDIVFQAGGRLYLLELDTEEYGEIDVSVVTDLASRRQRTESVGNLIQSAHISPTGKRAVFQARGEIFTVPAEHGMVRKLTHTSGVAERYPAWSPDGKNIAFWSDKTGEYELVMRAADGSGEERTLTSMGPGYRYQPFWSPDSKKIAFIDNAQIIRVYDLDSGRMTEVDRGLTWLHGALQGFEVSWSSDSRWIAHSRDLETGNGAIFLFDTKENQRHQVTSGYYSDFGPAFDPDGKYLYYFSNRTLRPIYSDMDQTWIYPNTTNVVAVALREDVASPLAPRNDEEKVAEEGEQKEGEGTGEGEGAGDGTKDVVIDIDAFESRGIVLPAEPGNYNSLRAVSGKVIYHRHPRSGSSDEQHPVVFYDLKEREEKTIVNSANGFEISADGKKMLVANRGQWSIIAIAASAKLDKQLATGDMEMVLDPKQEWRQLFTEVWRTYRDVFYDPGMHGLDWDGLRDHYGDMLESAVTRWDVNFVIGELIAEVNASHTYVGGGDVETSRRRQVGLLGVDWELENGAYRIARIVEGAPWDIGARSPLAEPGVDVSEGDYILAVNGLPIDASREPHAAFEGLAGATVMLMVNDGPSMDGARQVLVETLRSESRLRNLAWIEANRKRVEEATDGRVGYIFVPNTAVSGQTELVRQFNSQMRKDGLIIDERFNGGGQLPDRFIEMMNRQMVSRLYFRNGMTVTWPAINHYGPKVMLINGWAGSGGDAYPWFFKEMNVGPLIGERTWGGLIGPASGHGLIDGGFYTAPPGRLYGTDGTWFAEGHGVDPDIPVVDDQGELAKGRDPQLEAAIEEVMRLIRQNPPTFPDPPAFERRIATDGNGNGGR